MRAVAVTQFQATPIVVDIPKPEPGPGEILVKVQAAGLNPVDLLIADGVIDPQARFPLVMGVDYAGTVAHTGSGEVGFAVGDRVFGQAPPTAGTLSEYVVVPADGAVALLPPSVPPDAGAALPTAGMTALQIMQRAAIKPGQSLLIVGAAGGVGSYLTQLAAANDVRVIAAVRGQLGQLMGELGAARTIDVTVHNLVETVREEYPDGVDVLVDLASGSPQAFTTGAALVADGGVALSTRGAADPERLPSYIESINLTMEPGTDSLDELAQLVASGRLSVIVGDDVGLADAPERITALRGGGVRGKTVVRP